VVAKGTPEMVAHAPSSVTGRFLADMFRNGYHQS